MLRRMAPVLAPALLLVAACTGGSDTAEPGVTVPAPTDVSPTPTDDDDQTSPGTASGPSASTAVGRPAPGTCSDLAEAADGVYRVADAGEAEVRREGDQLVVGEVRPAEGWTHEVVEAEQHEVEIEFRRGGEEVDLEIEIDDGRLTADLCSDDD